MGQQDGGNHVERGEVVVGVREGVGAVVEASDKDVAYGFKGSS
jgi:hypothetical protein